MKVEGRGAKGWKRDGEVGEWGDGGEDWPQEEEKAVASTQ
jgi:hypothetical protein